MSSCFFLLSVFLFHFSIVRMKEHRPVVLYVEAYSVFDEEFLRYVVYSLEAEKFVCSPEVLKSEGNHDASNSKWLDEMYKTEYNFFRVPVYLLSYVYLVVNLHSTGYQFVHMTTRIVKLMCLTFQPPSNHCRMVTEQFELDVRNYFVQQVVLIVEHDRVEFRGEIHSIARISYVTMSIDKVFEELKEGWLRPNLGHLRILNANQVDTEWWDAVYTVVLLLGDEFDAIKSTVRNKWSQTSAAKKSKTDG